MGPDFFKCFSQADEIIREKALLVFLGDIGSARIQLTQFLPQRMMRSQAVPFVADIFRTS